MNIFYLDHDPQTAAQYHCDKHVVKMILESAQLLSTAHRVLDGVMVNDKRYVQGSLPARWRNVKVWRLDNEFDSVYYSATHLNHPSAVWVRTSCEHYIWLHGLFQYLLEEYTYRYGKNHKCGTLLNPLTRLPVNIPNSGWQEPPQCMPDDCKDSSSSVIAYRNYYKNHKARFAKWSVRPTPFWWDDTIQEAA
jgi:hypothetical protein